MCTPGNHNFASFNWSSWFNTKFTLNKKTPVHSIRDAAHCSELAGGLFKPLKKQGLSPEFLMKLSQLSLATSADKASGQIPPRAPFPGIQHISSGSWRAALSKMQVQGNYSPSSERRGKAGGTRLEAPVPTLAGRCQTPRVPSWQSTVFLFLTR